MSKYMWILFISGSVPFVLSFWPALRFYRNTKALLMSIVLVLVVFGGWDVIATLRNHWYFNPDFVWKFRLFNLPLEEVLFFVVIPFCCIFTWEAVKYLTDRKK